MTEPLNVTNGFSQVVDLGGAQTGYDTSAWAMYAGAEVTVGTPVNNSKYAVQYMADNSGTPAIYVNGANNTFASSSIGAAACSGTMSVGANTGSGQPFNGYISEFGLNSAQFNTTGKAANINNNMRTAGGF